jgi:DHA1 family tetracycline resistance protein-like MFS transporter
VLAFLHFRRQRRQRAEIQPAGAVLETEDMQ